MSYKKEITNEQKRIKAIEENEWQKEDYINSCLPMVVTMAKNYAKKTKIDIDELIQEGNFGLCRAWEC